MSEKKNQLHALIAVQANVKGAAAKIAQETRITFKKKNEHFDGHSKTYQPAEEKGEQLPPDRKPLVTTVGEKLAHFRKLTIPALDAMIRLEETNQTAKADVIVDDFTLADVPATYLLQLDKKITEIRAVLGDIPTLDPNYDWHEDEIEGAGAWTTAPTKRNRTVKKIRHKVLVPPTEHHPAQVVEYADDVLAGEYTEKLQSGRLTSAKKSELLERADKLQIAVKKALSKANQEPHSTRKVGIQIFNFLFGDLPLSRGKSK